MSTSQSLSIPTLQKSNGYSVAKKTKRTKVSIVKKKEKSYSQKLKDPRWRAKRKQILIRDKYACQECGLVKLKGHHVHHLKYIGEPWETPDEFLVTLCKDHHDEIHKNGPKIERIIKLPGKKPKNTTPSGYCFSGNHIKQMTKSSIPHVRLFAAFLLKYKKGNAFKIDTAHAYVKSTVQMLLDDKCLLRNTKGVYRLGPEYLAIGSNSFAANNKIIEFAKKNNVSLKQIPHK